VVVIHRKRWSPSTGNPGRHGPERATPYTPLFRLGIQSDHHAFATPKLNGVIDDKAFRRARSRVVGSSIGMIVAIWPSSLRHKAAGFFVARGYILSAQWTGNNAPFQVRARLGEGVDAERRASKGCCIGGIRETASRTLSQPG
jgi:hypothetical protein